MFENKKELMKKGAIVLAVILVLGIMLIVFCGKDKEDNGNTEYEENTQVQEVVDGFITEDGTETEDGSVASTEAIAGEIEGQITDTSGVESNNSGQNRPSQNTSSEGNAQVGLGEESYEYIVNSSGAGSSKEKKLAKEIAKKIITKGMGDFEKVKAINDYMILNVAYDRENYERNTIPPESYTALGAMEKKVAVCAGYAQMFRLVAEAAGLDATYVCGDTPYGYHAWNQVKVDGKWYNIDVTWDDGDYEKKAMGHAYCGCYEYFLLSNGDFEKSHKPFSTVKNTGSSRDIDGIKEGCPYDGKAPYCETQADITKVVKEMVDSNTMTKRILLKGGNGKEMVENALSQLKVYAGYTVSENDRVRVYSHSKSALYKLTIEVELEAASFNEAKKQKINSMADAKRVCGEKINNYVPGNNNSLDTYYIFVNTKYVNDNDFKAEIMRWAFYEKKMNLFILNEWEQVDDSTYKTRIGLDSAANAIAASESIYHTKDIEAAIQRMFQYGYKKINLYINPSDYQITGGFNEAGRAFEDKFCVPLNEKYCLRSDWDQVHPDKNEICVYFSAEGHDVEYVDWEIEKEATCVSDGLQVKHCKICHEIGEQQTIPKNDNHDYYWDTVGSNRTRKCHSCSYTGISEVCIGGIWGYFDEAAAQAKIKEINERRAMQQVLIYDDWGAAIDLVVPAALTESSELTKKAKERLSYFAPLDYFSLDGALSDEHVAKTFEHLHDKRYTQTKQIGVDEDDIYRELNYETIGVTCFYYDHDGDGNRMMPIYIVEFGRADDE